MRLSSTRSTLVDEAQYSPNPSEWLTENAAGHVLLTPSTGHAYGLRYLSNELLCFDVTSAPLRLSYSNNAHVECKSPPPSEPIMIADRIIAAFMSCETSRPCTPRSGTRCLRARPSRSTPSEHHHQDHQATYTKKFLHSTRRTCCTTPRFQMFWSSPATRYSILHSLEYTRMMNPWAHIHGRALQSRLSSSRRSFDISIRQHAPAVRLTLPASSFIVSV